MNFNEKLIKLRKLKGLSQEELGDKLNVSRQTVSKWELGQTTPEMENLIQLSNIFNVSIDALTNKTDLPELENLKFKPSSGCENIIGKDENVIWEGKPKKSSYLIQRIFPLIIVLIVFLFFIGIFMTIQSLVTGISNIPKQMIEKTGDMQQTIMGSMNNAIASTNGGKTISELEEGYNTSLKQIEAEYQEELENVDKEHQAKLEQIETEYQNNLAEWSEAFKEQARIRRDNAINFEEEMYKTEKERALMDYNFEKRKLDNDFDFEKSGINSQEAMNNFMGIFDIFGFKDNSNGLDISSPFKGIQYFMILILGIILISIVSSIIATIMQLKNLKYIITDKRAIIQKGAIGLDYRAIEYTKIDDILVNVGLVDKMFNTGTIVLVNEYAYSSGNRANRTSGHYYKKMDESNSFMAVQNPYEIFNKIKEVSQNIRTDMYYPNDLRPEGNKGYKTKYDNEEKQK